MKLPEKILFLLLSLIMVDAIGVYYVHGFSVVISSYKISVSTSFAYALFVGFIHIVFIYMLNRAMKKKDILDGFLETFDNL